MTEKEITKGTWLVEMPYGTSNGKPEFRMEYSQKHLHSG